MFQASAHNATDEVLSSYRTPLSLLMVAGVVSCAVDRCCLRARSLAVRLHCPEYIYSSLALLAAHEPSHVFRWSKEEHLRTLKLFADESSAPYSMHKIVSVGVTLGKKVGEWYGPTTIASVLRCVTDRICISLSSFSDLVNNRTGEGLRAYVSRDSGMFVHICLPRALP